MAEIQKDEYKLKYTDQFDLTLNDEATENIELEVAPEVPQSGLVGRVWDEENNPVEGATVKIFDLDFNPLMHTVTDEYGMYLFSDVAPGEYLVYAVKDNYNLSKQNIVTITDKIEGKYNIRITKNNLDQTSVYYGKVKDEEGNPIGSVIIDLIFDGDLKYTTISADDGEFIVRGITAGEYNIEAYNDKYKVSGIRQIVFSSNSNFNQDIPVVRYGEIIKGTINGVVTQKETKLPIEGAFVALYKVENNTEEMIATTLTDEQGRYFFGLVPEGQYIVKSIK